MESALANTCLSWTLLVVVSSLIPTATAADIPITAKVDFARDIAPVLQHRCIHCHQPGNDKSRLSLATFADLASNSYVIPGEPDASHLLDVITAADGEMPLMPKEGPSLSPDQISLLRQWIAEGANWPTGVVIQERPKADRAWWSLLPLAEIESPSTAIPPEWIANSIDRFVYAGLDVAGLRPNSPADRRTLIRRVTYDLTGLPPEPEEIETFLHDDSPDAYEKLVDRLLASPRYGEHWGRHWLDVDPLRRKHRFRGQPCDRQRLAVSRLRHSIVQRR